MKSLVLSVIALGLGASMSFANAENVNTEKEIPFNIEFNRLNTYLSLEPTQTKKVYKINEDFIWEQQESLSEDAKSQEEGMQKALSNNLESMKEVLTTEQYRKYVKILNVTKSNKQTSSEDTYLGEKD